MKKLTTCLGLVILGSALSITSSALGNNLKPAVYHSDRANAHRIANHSGPMYHPHNYQYGQQGLFPFRGYGQRYPQYNGVPYQRYYMARPLYRPYYSAPYVRPYGSYYYQRPFIGPRVGIGFGFGRPYGYHGYRPYSGFGPGYYGQRYGGFYGQRWHHRPAFYGPGFHRGPFVNRYHYRHTPLYAPRHRWQ